MEYGLSSVSLTGFKMSLILIVEVTGAGPLLAVNALGLLFLYPACAFFDNSQLLRYIRDRRLTGKRGVCIFSVLLSAPSIFML